MDQNERKKIIVLDEATANIDLHTDSLIQQTVRQKFRDCSVLTVAHRLNTIMDSDKMLVMDYGSLVEYGHPYVLLQNKGHFYHMVQQTGPTMAASLAEIAEEIFYAPIILHYYDSSKIFLNQSYKIQNGRSDLFTMSR